MPKISEKIKNLDDGKADLLGADLVDADLVGQTRLKGGYTTGSIHYENRASVIFYENTETKFVSAC